MLSEKAKAPVRLLVVWTPVLKTDVGPPTTQAMSLVDDARARQFWDPEHVFSTDVVRAWHGEPKTVGYGAGDMTRPDFVVWDWVAVFPKDARWTANMPPPAYAGGDVVSVIDDAKRQLANELKR